MILSRLARHLAATLLLALLAAPPALLVPAPARATVNSTVSKTIVLGDGITTIFNFNFVGVAAQYISVILTDSSGNETVLTQGAGTTQYTITLNAPVTGAIWGLGGSITYNPSGTPVPAGATLTIFRTLPLTQAISLQNQNSLARLGNGAETGLDLGVMQTQQQVEVLNRAIVAPIVDATPPAPLPPIAQRANQGAAFDAQGNLVAGQTPSGGVISSAMQPVVNAATLAAGRTAFGLRAMATEGIGGGLSDDGAGSVRINSPIVSVATNQAVDATFYQKRYRTTGPINFTLPRVNTLFNGFGFWIENNTAGAVALIINANDTVYGYSSGVAVSIPANVVAYVSTDAANTGTILIDFSAGTQTPVAATLGGLTLSTGGGSGNFAVSTGVASDRNYGGLMRLNSAAAKTTTAWSTGGGSLDTGTIAANTWYHVFIIGRPDQAIADVLISLSPTAPTMPANYTLFRRIGSMKTDGSQHWIGFVQYGNDFLWRAPPQDIAVGNLGAVPTSYILAGVPTGVDVIAHLTGTFNEASNGTSLLIQSPDATGAGPSISTGLITARVVTGSVAVPFVTDIRTNTSAQIVAYGNSVNCTLAVSTKGWLDFRGQ
jgi:hypothetical protein